jgi:2-polyprenyl-6-methoxyphenol hydroxylase-like FAD-dependent oxidoreductase
VDIVGGGIGGLCLAQGLKRAGVGVAVYERDRTAETRQQGYRLDVEPDGSRALLRRGARGFPLPATGDLSQPGAAAHRAGFFRLCGAVPPLRRAVFDG